MRGNVMGKFITNGVQNRLQHNDLRTWGCYILTLIAWAETAFGQILIKNEETLVKKFNEWQSKNWINRLPNEKGIVYPWARNPVAIFNELALEAGKGDGYFANVEHTNGNRDFPKTRRFPVFYKRTTLNGFDHFALGELGENNNVRIVFDSWNNSAAARGMPIHNFRRFR